MMNIKIIGLGGIGSALSEFLGRFLNYSENFNGVLTLIDGKEYREKNKHRQLFSQIGGNKALSKTIELSSKFKKLKLKEEQTYVTKSNISSFIKNGDIVFVCVDNHVTRKLVSDFGKELDDIIIISGGNEWTDGNVQIFSKKGGIQTHPSITDYHPEIESPEDSSPDKMSCEELEKSAPQLFFANITVAVFMSWVFYNIYTTGNVPKQSEIYFDITLLATNTVERSLLS